MCKRALHITHCRTADDRCTISQAKCIAIRDADDSQSKLKAIGDRNQVSHILCSSTINPKIIDGILVIENGLILASIESYWSGSLVYICISPVSGYEKTPVVLNESFIDKVAVQMKLNSLRNKKVCLVRDRLRWKRMCSQHNTYGDDR